MPTKPKSVPALDFDAENLRRAILAIVREDGPCLSLRDLGVFLISYLEEGPHTVRGLAAELEVPRSIISRALDKLGDLDLARRKDDPSDRRSVLVDRTNAGRAVLGRLKASVAVTGR